MSLPQDTIAVVKTFFIGCHTYGLPKDEQIRINREFIIKLGSYEGQYGKIRSND